MSERQKTAIEMELEELNMNLSRINTLLNELLIEIKEIRNTQEDVPYTN